VLGDQDKDQQQSSQTGTGSHRAHHADEISRRGDGEGQRLRGSSDVETEGVTKLQARPAGQGAKTIVALAGRARSGRCFAVAWTISLADGNDKVKAMNAPGARRRTRACRAWPESTGGALWQAPSPRRRGMFHFSRIEDVGRTAGNTGKDRERFLAAHREFLV